jgi:DNA segregation ATPase FtsK/SpoIIIE, S-DNA-T family
MSMAPFTRGRASDRTPVTVRSESVRIGLIMTVLLWLARQLVRAIMITARTPLLLAAFTLMTGLLVFWAQVGRWPAFGLVLAAIGGTVGWRLRWPNSFGSVVGDRVRSSGRWFWTYRRFWQPAMVTADLAQYRDGSEFLPRLLSVTSTRWVDWIRVRLLPGQTLDDWAEITHRLAQSFGVESCRVHSTRDVHIVEIWCLRRDPLSDPIPPVEPDRLDLHGLQVGRGEDGNPFRLGLLGHHLLAIGATGAGKSELLQALIKQLSPGLADRSVRLWVIDPKGGMEFALGQALYDRFAYGSHPRGREDACLWEESFAVLLEDAVAVMRDRQDRLRGVTRLHRPTPSDPLIVIIIDELASLTAYMTDRNLKKRIEAALCLLLSQGRAVGVSVVAAVQDPRKDTIPMRDLFTIRICLRVTEAEHVTLALGAGARAKGANAERIGFNLPGVGFVQIDGLPEPVRVRFAHVTDDHIATLVATITGKNRTDDHEQLRAVSGVAA